MKKGGPLKRKTPMARSQSPAQRSTALTRSAMKPKRPTISAEEKAARKTVRARSSGVCEGCGQRPARDWAHRVGRGQGGPWSAVNGLDLCNPGGCHDRAHANPVWARDRGWIVLSTQDPATVPVLLAGRGWVLLTETSEVIPSEEEAA